MTQIKASMRRTGQGGSFRGILVPNGLDKIRSPVPLHLVFLDHDVSIYNDLKPQNLFSTNSRYALCNDKQYSTSGFMRPTHFEKVFGQKHLWSEERLTFVMTNNIATDWVPLSPWIVCHRLAHAFSEVDSIERVMARELGCVIGAIRDTFVDEKQGAMHIGQWASARHKTLRDVNEFGHEAFACFMMKGEIKIDPGNDERIEAWKTRMERFYTSLLRHSLGKILVL